LSHVTKEGWLKTTSYFLMKCSQLKNAETQDKYNDLYCHVPGTILAVDEATWGGILLGDSEITNLIWKLQIQLKFNLIDQY
jgi:hypothetical protein